MTIEAMRVESAQTETPVQQAKRLAEQIVRRIEALGSAATNGEREIQVLAEGIVKRLASEGARS